MNKALQGSLATAKFIKNYARRWPREIFDCVTIEGGKKKLLFKHDDLKILQEPGVYILYREDIPFYIGKADSKLSSRLYSHARRHGGPYTYYWNYFSVFAIPDKDVRTLVESILIAAIPRAANSSKPKLNRQTMPKKVIKMVRQVREIEIKIDTTSPEVDEPEVEDGDDGIEE